MIFPLISVWRTQLERGKRKKRREDIKIKRHRKPPRPILQHISPNSDLFSERSLHQRPRRTLRRPHPRLLPLLLLRGPPPQLHLRPRLRPDPRPAIRRQFEGQVPQTQHGPQRGSVPRFDVLCFRQRLLQKDYGREGRVSLGSVVVGGLQDAVDC